MDGQEDDEAGMEPFAPRENGRDYSGLSIQGSSARELDLGESFFNGANISESRFVRCQLGNSEFNECRIEACVFDRAVMQGCDFIHSEVFTSRLTECDLTKGEWRETVFRNCVFIDCDFRHNTVTLCRFQGCTFDDPTCRTLEQQSIYYNTFTGCVFSTPFEHPPFVSRNFGVPAGQGPALLTAHAVATLEQACRLNNIGKLRSIDMAEAAEALCLLFETPRKPRNSTLAFLSKILRTLNEERRISATTLLYVEDVVSKLASTVDGQELFTVAMTAVVEIRSALFAMNADGSDYDGAEAGAASAVVVKFSETYGAQQVEVLRDTLEATARIRPGGLRIVRLESGSTLVELASSALVSVAGMLAALNLILHQATITLENLAKLKKASLRALTVKRSRTRSTKVTVPDILRSGVVAPELAPVKAAVRRHGKALIEMDEPATVHILADLG